MSVTSTSSTTRPNARRAPATPARAARRTRPGTAPAGQLRQIPIAGSQPKRSSSAGDVVSAYLKIQVAALRDLEPKVRADEYDSVHQMRVATRRLRAALRSFGQVIPRPQTERTAAELKWLGGLLGEARDGEVIPAHLAKVLEPVPVELLIGPVQARIQGHFAPRRASAREQVIEAFDGERYANLLDALDRLALDPPQGPRAGEPARDVLPRAVHKAYRQAARRMKVARHTPPGHARDVALHQAR